MVHNPFFGEGDVRALARSIAWPDTALGAAETWPEGLRAVTDVCLQSELPMLLAWGPDLVQIYNDACCELLGSRHPAAMGQPARACWSDLWERVAPVLERVTTGRERSQMSVRFPRSASPEGAPVTLMFSPLGNGSEEPAGVLVIGLDASAQELRERHLAALSSLTLETVGLAALPRICAAACDILVGGSRIALYALAYVNEGSASRLLGCAGIAPGGPTAPELVQLANGPEGDPWGLAGVSNGHVVTLDPADDDRPDARAAALVLPLAAPRRGRTVGALVVGARSEKAIDDPFRAFARRFAAVTATVIESSARSESLRRRTQALIGEMEMQSRFMAGISHELRTPISAIMAHAEICKEGYAGVLTERQARHIGSISTAAVHLLGQVEEILEFSRRRAGSTELNVQEISIGDVIEELSDFLDPLFRERGLQYETHVPTGLRPIRTDRIKVRQILTNLLSNAQKYTTAGSVQLVVDQATDDSIRVTVRDTGPGIEPAQQERIFEPFERVGGRDDPGGTGLGLTVARSLAHLLGGDLTLSSVPGEGSVFTLRVGHLPDVVTGESVPQPDVETSQGS